MESMGIPVTPSILELTIATPAHGNGIHNSSSSGSSDAYKGSNIENTRELALLDTFDLPVSGGGKDVDMHIIDGTEVEGDENRQLAGSWSAFQPRRCRRISKEQSGLLEESFQQNHYPNKGAKQALADTLKVTLKQVQSWFLNRRSRLKKKKMEQNETELESYKRQVESLTNEKHHLQRKLKKLKKKLKQASSMATPPPPPPPPAAEHQKQQNQVMYVPVL